ncbi:DUF72 domain-containing protein [Iodidimonas sp. SYSU 1G8]|uniref:DUF72 domain-containing protein n=1 Tax=Iodidimonas sp. SYSU 1G8 TaxID=3133967 RepID=UPI0031FE891E
MPPMTTCRIGIAGWAIRSEHRDNFPGPGTHLERYARHFNAVEINSSFYRPHQRATYERWRESVRDGFRFAVKTPRSITHAARLHEADKLVEDFLEQAHGLKEKLGVLLVQLPPRLAFSAETAARFFDCLQTQTDAHVACEPRHASWFTEEAGDLLAQRGIARVAADPAPCPGADEPGGSEKLVYYRLHGAPRMYWSPYSEADLTRIEAHLGRHAENGANTWCIFDNTAAGAATTNALALTKRL